ncbi:MAG: hypothetical protein D6729_05130, partial [Deltaproteobacteria bacterium]
DIDEAFDSIQYALEVARRPDVHIWFNRFPPPYLEGHEHLIQDPYKLNDEVRGRYEEYERWLEHGQPLSCREPERCKRCYLEQLCQTLEDTLEAVRNDGFEAVRFHLEGEDRPLRLPRLPGSYERIWLTGPDLPAVERALPRLPAGPLILELADYEGLDSNTVGDRPVLRALAATPEAIDRLLRIDADFEVVAILTRDTAAHLLEAYPTPPARLRLAGRNYERLTEAKARDADLHAFFAAYDPSVPVENVPACISGRPPSPAMRVLDAEMLNEGGRLDIYGYARRYILDHYYTKRRACRDCVHDATCRGAHINWIRAHGYATLQPIRAEDAAATDAAPGASAVSGAAPA